MRTTNPVGWRGESYRHYLAQKGIKTKIKQKYREEFPLLVKPFEGQNPRITKNYARFRQEAPGKFDEHTFKTKEETKNLSVILGEEKKSGRFRVQSVLVRRKNYWDQKVMNEDDLWNERKNLIRRRNELLIERDHGSSSRTLNELHAVDEALHHNAKILGVEQDGGYYSRLGHQIELKMARQGRGRHAKPTAEDWYAAAAIAEQKAADALERYREDTVKGGSHLKQAQDMEDKMLLYEELASRADAEHGTRGSGYYAKRILTKKGKIHVTRSGEEVIHHAELIENKIRPYAKIIAVAGSIRRKRENPVDVDIVVVPKVAKKEKIKEIILSDATKVYSNGDKKISVRKNGIKTEVVFTKPDEFGAALLQHTGSSGHNIGLRILAKKQGLLLNDKGLFKGQKKIAGRSERGIYRALHRPKFKQPEERS
jgi:DNA polymerase/3'-5' exonuclease PolX